MIISDFYVRNQICAAFNAQLYLSYSAVRETDIKNKIWPQCSNRKNKKRGRTLRLE